MSGQETESVDLTPAALCALGDALRLIGGRRAVAAADALHAVALEGPEPPHAEDAGNVVTAPILTTLGVPVHRVLRSALKADLRDVVVVGYDAEGDEYFASSMSDGAEVVWMLERAKLQLLTVVDEISA